MPEVSARPVATVRHGPEPGTALSITRPFSVRGCPPTQWLVEGEQVTHRRLRRLSPSAAERPLFRPANLRDRPKAVSWTLVEQSFVRRRCPCLAKGSPSPSTKAPKNDPGMMCITNSVKPHGGTWSNTWRRSRRRGASGQFACRRPAAAGTLQPGLSICVGWCQGGCGQRSVASTRSTITPDWPR